MGSERVLIKLRSMGGSERVWIDGAHVCSQPIRVGLFYSFFRVFE